MKIISWNTRGLKDPTKCLALKKFIKNHHPDVVMIQDRKWKTLMQYFVKSIWNSKDSEWEFVESLGASGGILTMWDKSKITVVENIKGRFSLSIKGDTMCKKRCWITNVYGSCGYWLQRKKLFGQSSHPF